MEFQFLAQTIGKSNFIFPQFSYHLLQEKKEFVNLIFCLDEINSNSDLRSIVKGKQIINRMRPLTIYKWRKQPVSVCYLELRIQMERRSQSKKRLSDPKTWRLKNRKKAAIGFSVVNWSRRRWRKFGVEESGAVDMGWR